MSTVGIEPAGIHDGHFLRMLSAIRAQRSHLLAGFAFVILAASVSAAGAEEVPPPQEQAAPRNDAERFCANIGDAAADARFAWQAKTLKDLEAEVETATAALEAKRAELEAWVTRRDDLQKLAQQVVVDIYAKMRPEAAASQLSALDEKTAAAVLIKLNSRVASAILAEMDTPRAVSLAEVITGDQAEPSDVSQQ
jgi:flagellar motility protein MotE (MotC chaperone)